ncbi:DMT family transporter, partial [Acidithiobacillus sp. MC6.1]|nr:DMT family transporter [Acidithiobacillus sp. MC6.1]
DHLAATTANFLYSGFAAIIMLGIYALMKTIHHVVINISFAGLYYTILIGAITSALVYVIWYMLMKELSGITSAVIQMLVPVIVVISSAPLLGEHLTPRLLGAGAAMLAGILMVTLANKKEDSRKSKDRDKDT